MDIFSAALAALLLVSVAGCRSMSGPGSASFASVVISGHTAQEIAETTGRVFGEDGWQGGVTDSGQLIFQKEASRATTMAREGLVATHYGAQTFIRVRTDIVPLSGGVFRLQCKAYTVTGGGDPFFQDEVALSNARGRAYQQLLDKVASQLKTSAPAPAASK